jgi:LacI family transcriptional regulator
MPDKRAKVTINDLARACGVSKVTVSYVLNNTERSEKISEATKERIRAAALELGYHPNLLARSLTSRRTDSLLLVMPYATMFTGGSAFMTDLMKGAMASAGKFGFDLMLQTKSRNSANDELAGIVDGRSDGALLLREASDPIVEALIHRRFPAVYIFGQTENPLVSSVDTDNIAGGIMAVDYLIRQGHRRIAFVGGAEYIESNRLRKQGYLSAMAATNLTVDPSWMFSEEMGTVAFTGIQALLTANNPPTALFCWNDDIAYGVIKYLQNSMGLRVPADISVVGFDSTDFCEHTSPRLTSIRQPFELILDRAFQIVKSLIDEEPHTVQKVRFEPILDERDSVRKIFT